MDSANNKFIIPTSKHLLALIQHLITYPVFKAGLAATAATAAHESRVQIALALAKANSAAIFALLFFTFWSVYLITYSIKGKRYSFIDKGEFHEGRGGNIEMLPYPGPGLGLREAEFYFKIRFHSKLATIPVLDLPIIDLATHMYKAKFRIVDLTDETAIVAIGTVPSIPIGSNQPRNIVYAFSYNASANDPLLPKWLKSFFEKFPGKY